MALRIRARWHTDKDRSLQELAGALGFLIWKISANSLLEMENEGFVTYSNAHRLEVIREFVVFLIQAADRLVYERLEDDERRQFVIALAIHLAQTFAENQQDIFGGENRYPEYKQKFIEFFNERADQYSELGFTGDDPHLDFLRHFGNAIESVIGDSSNKHWASQHVIEYDAPQALKSLRKAVRDLLDEA